MFDHRDEDAEARAALLAILRSPPPPRSLPARSPRGLPPRTGRLRFLWVTLGSVALMLVCMLTGLVIGSVSIPAGDALAIVAHWLSGGWLATSDWRAAMRSSSCKPASPG